MFQTKHQRIIDKKSSCAFVWSLQCNDYACYFGIQVTLGCFYKLTSVLRKNKGLKTNSTCWNYESLTINFKSSQLNELLKYHQIEVF